MSAPTAYPLAWPAGRPRVAAANRVRGRFNRKEHYSRVSAVTGTTYSGMATRDLTVAVAVERMQAEIDRIGAQLPVLSTNLELRLGGLPRSNQRRPEDPGVALYFQLDGDPVVLACDRYDTVEANIAAIAAHLEASRAIERHGVGTLREIFRGFTALPPAMAVDDWRTVLGDPKTLAEAESVYRDAMRTHHPDVGGSEARAAALNAAIAMAREVLS